MAKKDVVELSTEEQALLNEMITSGMHRVRKTNHARILLKAGAGWTDEAISEALNVSIPTIQRVRQRFVEQSFELALTPSRSRRKYQRLLDGVQEAHLIALTCSSPPQGYRRWSLRLLAEKMVQMAYVQELSHETVRQVLAENELKPWLRQFFDQAFMRSDKMIVRSPPFQMLHQLGSELGRSPGAPSEFRNTLPDG